MHPKSTTIPSEAAQRRGVFAWRLAGEFLRESLGDSRDWPTAFQAWASDRGLQPALRDAVKVEVVRIRFGATGPQEPRQP